MRATQPLMPLAACVLVLAGCGSSGPSRAEYIKQADGVCTNAGKQLATAQAQAISKLGTNPKRSDLAKIVSDVIVPNAETQLAELRKLEKPGDDVQTLDSLYADIEAGLAEVKANPGAVQEDPDGPLVRAKKKAQAYGMKVCGSGA